MHSIINTFNMFNNNDAIFGYVITASVRYPIVGVSLFNG
jgi:hypothetical protein